MSRYTNVELKKMGQTLLEAKESNDPRYYMFVLNLSLVTGQSQKYIEDMVQYYADMVVDV